MKIQPEMLVVLVHICLILVYTILIYWGKLHLRKEHIIPLFLIPVFGLFIAMMIEFMLISGKQGAKSLDLERLDLGDDILWANLRSFQENGDLVPLEESILINDVKVRRRSMLETLYADPFKYLDILNIAKHNEDIETSHYATTTISKAQKDFQDSIQKYAHELKRNPDDSVVLDAYIETLGKYIQSNLLEENLVNNLRITYSEALDKKLAMVKDDKHALTAKLRNAVQLKNYACAFQTASLLKKYWPQEEQTWIDVLRVCVEGNDCRQLTNTIEEIKQREITWTDQGREQVSPWIKMATK